MKIDQQQLSISARFFIPRHGQVYEQDPTVQQRLVWHIPLGTLRGRLAP